MEDRKIPLADAIEIIGSEDELREGAKSLGIAPNTISMWFSEKREAVPAYVVLELLRRAGRIRSEHFVGPLWRNPEWRDTRIFTVALECLRRLAARDEWQQVRGLSRLLEKMAGWTERDWRLLYEQGTDRLIDDLREEIERHHKSHADS